MLHFKPSTVKHCPYHGKKCPNIQISDRLGLRGSKLTIKHAALIPHVIEVANSTCILASVAARNTISRRLGIIYGTSSSPWMAGQIENHYPWTMSLVFGDHYRIALQSPVDKNNRDSLNTPPNDKLDREEIPNLLNQMERINDSFEEFIADNLWYIIKNAHVRVLISILETFAEKPATAGAAVAANTFVRTLRLARMVTDPQSKVINPPGKSVTGISPFMSEAKKQGVHHSYLIATDTARVMINRLRSVLYLHPELWIIVYRILKYDLKDKKNVLNTADNVKFYRAWGGKHDKFSLVNYTEKFLNPSPINLKYQYLYTQLHSKKKGYGSGNRFLSADKKFLLDNRCNTIMDFGCGKTKDRDSSFTWVYYDPCIADRRQLYEGTVDGLVCYVLEHIPINDLQVFVRWVKIYKPRCIVLGISTRPAKAKLANGEKAHCTVKNDAWWVDWAIKNFGDTSTVRNIKCAKEQYLTLHISDSYVESLKILDNGG